MFALAAQKAAPGPDCGLAPLPSRARLPALFSMVVEPQHLDKIITSLASAIDLQKSKVKVGPQRVTVFGGPALDDENKPTSQRAIFLLSPGALADHLVVPEDFKNWNHFGTYDNLLNFEEDVCALVDTVLVFLESAGSIAEFAAFIKNKDIAPKLFVVANSEHDQDSFIRLGLIKYLTSEYSNRINFITSRASSLEIEEIQFILAEINKRFQNTPRAPAFTRTNTRHMMYLIVDFIDLIQVARISDIQLFLKELGFLVSKRRTEQLILALKNVRLINEDRVLSERCFFLDDATSLIDYSFHVGATAKRLSWKARLFEKTMDDKWRAFAFRHLKQPQQKELSNVA
ncbi:hypothetical protein GTP41_19320 [Pseudoduganella sp. DS3]|uniref:Uncharacterized protein n=1 Tax=Pseudoduganella guangdongensis TaxID=2692179 RepID=A0A6N9HLK9_9BURK|nr:retron St85 family effector protein [Pseudoduganella guangdongensis]MYN04246.1 hypothetical protein [Pseudoduganella guangdongensis]